MKALWTHFDKLLLLAVALVLLFDSHISTDKESMAWAQGQVGTIIGALLGLITGRMFQRSSDSPGTREGDGKPTTVTTTESSNQPLPIPSTTEVTTRTIRADNNAPPLPPAPETPPREDS